MSNAFAPTRGKSIAPTATSSSGSTAVSIDQTSRDIRVLNKGTVGVYITWYNSLKVGSSTAPDATSADMWLEPGAIEVFNKFDADTIKLLSSGADCTVRITPGLGE